MKALEKPLTNEEIKTLRDKDNYIEGVIKIELSDAIDNYLDGFLDLISERLVDSPCLMDISYKVVGAEGEMILLQVTGDTSDIIRENG